MKQSDRNKVFLLQMKQMIADYGGRENLSDVLVLENPEAFNYIEYNDAKANEKANETFKKKGIRNKYDHIKRKVTFGQDHIKLFTLMPESIIKALPAEIAYYWRKKLSMPIRRYQKTA